MFSIDQLKTMNGYSLPVDTMNCIQQLMTDIGLSIVIKPNAIANAHGHPHGHTSQPAKAKYSHQNRHDTNNNNASWKKAPTPSFQATVFEKTTNKIDQITETLRLLLNKLSDKTYEKIKSDVCLILDENEMVEEYAVDISKIIFDLASSNRFYSQCFAELYAHLIAHYQYMRPTLEINIQSFVGLFDTIVCVDANTNYEAYCECNKVNERRRALAAFFVSLMKIGVIANEQIILFLSLLLQKFHEYIEMVNKKNETNEICEVVSILFDKSYLTIPITNTIHGHCLPEYMKMIAQSKVSHFKSLTSKSIFKFMDLLDM